MNKQKMMKYYNKLLMFLKKMYKIVKKTERKVIEQVRKKINSWWKIGALFVFVVVFLYYPVGGWMINNIDTSSEYRPQTENGNLAAIDMISYLVNREVYYKIWTPNLPFLFPSYFLDNMPNFQLGLMSAVGQSVTIFDRMPINVASNDIRKDLSEAAELLQYPGNIWLFSPQNKLLPAPSSNTQYKKGRKKLNNFNNEMATGKVILERSAENLEVFLKSVRKDILRQVAKTENYVRENQKNWFDTKADDVFYFEQGKLYAYAQILRAWGMDFKNVLVKYDVYQQWTAMLKSLEEASDLNPSVIRNAKVNSSLAPNHLITLNYFASRAVNRIDSIIGKISLQRKAIK